MAIGAGEYAVSPRAQWRDVLPTTAHRWVTRQPGRVRVLDCTPLDQESESVQWLSGYRVALLGGPQSAAGLPEYDRLDLKAIDEKIRREQKSREGGRRF